MPDYCLYLMTDDGHILRPIDLACADDAEALALAEGQRGLRPAELWQRARVVAKLPKRQDA